MEENNDNDISYNSSDAIGFSNSLTPNKSDVDAFKNLGTNQGEYSTSFSRRRKDSDDDEEESSNSKKGLEKKDGLDKKEGLEKKDKLENKKNNVKDEKNNKNIKGKSSSLKDKVIEKTPIGKIMMLKIYLKIAGIGVGIALALFMFIGLFLVFDRFINSVSSFFGISEVDTEENMSVEDADGLLTSEEYLINPETGEYFTLEGEDSLVTYLSENNDKCTKSNIFNSIVDAIEGIDDICSLLRYVDKQEEKIEKRYSNMKLDRGLILASIFYGYSFQPDYTEMEDPNNEENEVVPATQYYKTFEDIFSDGKLSRTDIDELINYSYGYTSYVYYRWTIENVTNASGEVTKSVGKCVATNVTQYGYNSDKWKIFMRFGAEAANKYEELIAQQNAYQKSDEECSGKLSDEELFELVKSSGKGTAELDESVKTATSALSNGEITGIDAFLQEADNESNTADIFTSYSDGTTTIDFDYRNGFVYNKFPYFKDSIENSNIKVEYDDIVTPKTCEDAIDYILEKKPDMNEILDLEDMDEAYTYLTNANTETSVVLGAYCNNHLSAPLDEITVNIQDCNGASIATQSFKDYIIGVTYGEIGYSEEEDYVKAEMVAAITYALHTTSNNTEGTLIYMRSGNCTQPYCSMSLGCYEKKLSICSEGSNCVSYIPGTEIGTTQYRKSETEEKVAKYEKYYEEIKDFIIISISNTDELYNLTKTQETLNKWKEEANDGKSYSQIIQDTYTDGTLVSCSGLSSDSEEDSDSTQTGYGPTDNEVKYGNSIVEGKYTKISSDLGNNYGFSYSRSTNDNSITINPEWVNNNIVTINSNCSEASWTEDYQVNIHSKSNFEKAYSSICNILTNGVKISNGKTCKYNVSDLSIGNTFIPRETFSGIVSDSSYGISQDFNYNKTYIINGKTYTPYSSSTTLNDYLEFVDALGEEEDCRNINYILYKYAFKDAGFVWGGNFGRNNSDKFNPMHYRINY